MNTSIHTARNLVATAVVLVGFMVAAAAIDGALVTIVALVELGVVRAMVPFVVIHYEEHEERLRYRHPGQP